MNWEKEMQERKIRLMKASMVFGVFIVAFLFYVLGHFWTILEKIAENTAK